MTKACLLVIKLVFIELKSVRFNNCCFLKLCTHLEVKVVNNQALDLTALLPIFELITRLRFQQKIFYQLNVQYM